VLIKATRLRASAGASALARHLASAEDNESVEIVQGTLADLADAVADARQFGRTYALRHFIIAPQVDMDRRQFHGVVEMLGDEFDFDPKAPLIVQHAKARAVVGVAGQHWHVVVPETDAATGRVLSSRFDHARHEKVARQVELLLGHPIIPGAHDLAVLAALRAGGKVDIANQLAPHLGQGERPAAAFTSIQHQSAKRAGIDLAIVRDNIRTSCVDAPTGPELRRRLTAHGLALARGEKAGTWVVLGPDSQFLGAAHRLAGKRKADFNTLMENDHDHDGQPTDPTKRRAVDPRRHANPTAGRSDDSGVGKKHRVANEGRERVRVRRDAGLAADHRDAHGAGGPEPRSASSEAGPAGHSQRLAANDQQRLIIAINSAAARVMALSKSYSSESSGHRVQQHLGAQEQHARARIAVAEARATVTISNRLHAARIYKDATETRHAELLQAYRSAQEREAAMSPSRRTVLDQLLGRQAKSTGTEAVEREIAALRRDVIDAERAVLGAMGNLARVEKAEAAERMTLLGEVEAERRSAIEALAEIAMARRLVKVFPAIAYCGPAFIAWAGSKVEGKRRGYGPRNPQARNIWGLPLDFG
jgi:hypothetical protein